MAAGFVLEVAASACAADFASTSLIEPVAVKDRADAEAVFFAAPPLPKSLAPAGDADCCADGGDGAASP